MVGVVIREPQLEIARSYCLLVLFWHSLIYLQECDRTYFMKEHKMHAACCMNPTYAHWMNELTHIFSFKFFSFNRTILRVQPTQGAKSWYEKGRRYSPKQHLHAIIHQCPKRPRIFTFVWVPRYEHEIRGIREIWSAVQMPCTTDLWMLQLLVVVLEVVKQQKDKSSTATRHSRSEHWLGVWSAKMLLTSVLFIAVHVDTSWDLRYTCSQLGSWAKFVVWFADAETMRTRLSLNNS